MYVNIEIKTRNDIDDLYNNYINARESLINALREDKLSISDIEHTDETDRKD